MAKDFTSILHDPATWVAVATTAFAVLVFVPLKNALTGALDKRAIRIKNELDEAVRLKQEAAGLLESYQKKYQEALKEADEIISTARNEASMLMESAKKEMDLAVKKRMESVMNRIAQAEKAALTDIQVNAIDIAFNAARIVIAEKMQQQGVGEELVHAAITDMQKKLH